MSNERKNTARYVTCVKSQGISLKAGTRYKVIEDSDCKKRGWFRVVDDTDEDFCFPAWLFKEDE